MEKKQRNRTATIERIVDAFERILAEQGIEAVSVNTIAQKANISKVLLYRYFGSLEGLAEYYMRMGRIIPQYTAAWLEQMQQLTPTELTAVGTNQSLHIFRQLRASRSSRELLKATVNKKDALTDTVSNVLDSELSRVLAQLAFLEGSDQQAASAVIFGALSYLTIQAQNNRPVIGLDLRNETDWIRIEEAIKMFCKALTQMVSNSGTSQGGPKPAKLTESTW